MASSASSLLLGALLPGASVAQSSDTTSVLPPPLELRVAEAVGELWGHAATAVTLEWGLIRDPASLGATTDFRLIGRGTDSWFAVLFEREGRPAFAVRMRAGLRRQVPVAARSVAAGTILDETDVEQREEIRWGPPGPSDPATTVIGWRVRQPLRAGEAIVSPAAAPLPVVNPGDRVRMVWRRGMVTVAIEGTALHEAAVGDEVNVRLKGRRGNARGVVTGPGRATLAQ